MKTEMVRSKDLQVGDKIQGADDTVWEVVKHVLPFNEDTVYVIDFVEVETGEKLTRYVPEIKRFAVLTP